MLEGKVEAPDSSPAKRRLLKGTATNQPKARLKGRGECSLNSSIEGGECLWANAPEKLEFGTNRKKEDKW